jgi:MYXO-CTERM domain-containing protein
VSGKGCSVAPEKDGQPLAAFWLALLAIALVAQRRWSGIAHGRNRQV